jgi:hypothetical protein
MVKITRNDVGYTFVSYAFWGFFGYLTFSVLYQTYLMTIQAGYNSTIAQSLSLNPLVFPFSTWWSALFTGIGPLLAFLLVGYGLNRIIGLRRPLLIFAGIVSPVIGITNLFLNTYGTMHPTTSIGTYALGPYSTIVSMLGLGILYIGLTSWMLGQVESGANPNITNGFAAWGGMAVPLIGGIIADATWTYAGFSAFTWGLLFINCIPFCMAIGGILAKESGPLLLKKKQAATAA